MIEEMGWTPDTFPDSGETALMRRQFRTAIACFNLQDVVLEAEARMAAGTAPAAVVDPRADTFSEGPADAVVDPWADTAEAGLEQVDVHSQSSTEVVLSDAEDEDMVVVDLPVSTAACPVFDLSPVGSPSAQQRGDSTPRGPPSVDPEEVPESKRRRPRSGIRLLTSPVMRQAASFTKDGSFEDYEGRIFPRSASVLFPSIEMTFMAVLQAGHADVVSLRQLTMTDIRQLTVCSKRWAAERPRCLSLTVRLPDTAGCQQQPVAQVRAAEAILQAPFGVASLSRAASRAFSGPNRDPTPASAPEDPVEEAPIELLSMRHLATMEWIPITQSAEMDTAPPSTISSQSSVSRQGGLAQGQPSGRGFPFATHDLPGRYDGVGDGRSIHTNLLDQWRRCECALPKPQTTFPQ